MKERLKYLDVVNVIACLAVVLLHHNSIVHYFTPTCSWSQALLVEVLCYFAVPIFWMLSGATLLEYREKYSTITFFKKRVKRVLIPYIIWQLIWFLIVIVKENKADLDVIGIIDGLLNNKFQSVYWFFPSIIMLYILMPLLSLLHKKKYLILYLIFILLFFTGFFAPILRFLNIYVNNYYYSNIYATIACSLIGYYITHYNLDNKIKLNIHILSLFLLLTRYIMTYYYSYNYGETYTFLFSYDYLTAIIPAVSLFLIIQDVFKNRDNYFLNFCGILSSSSLGVYLVHKLIMAIEFRVFQSYLTMEDFIWRIPMAILTWLISICIVVNFRKFKIGKLLFP